MAKNKFTAPSGFPEHLPEVLVEEMRIRDIMRSVYESYGYVPLETPSVEKMETLASKGEIKKEIYAITRALAEGENENEDRALRFDLTVPLARYVAEHQNELSFPFKRWQIQKVWRGDRPQAGRFREFYQADIDVIGNEKLPIHFDAEVVEMVQMVLEKINFGSFTININNRKFLQGILEEFGFKNDTSDQSPSIQNALTIIDKYDKVGYSTTIESLTNLGINKADAETLLGLIEERFDISEINKLLSKIHFRNPLIEQGIKELEEIAVLLNGKSNQKSKILVNPRIARGLDYYTGSVYETTIDGYEQYGSICSGGRYANLAEKFTTKHLPGVGISIGLSRLMYILEKEKLLTFEKKGVTDVFIALLGEHQRITANQLAMITREAGINTQVSHDGDQKLAKQFKYADKIKAEHVLVINEGKENDQSITVKNLLTGAQEIVLSTNELISKILAK